MKNDQNLLRCISRRSVMIGSAVSVGALALARHLGLQAEENKRSKSLNLLIIHTDEHSFRTLGCYRKHLQENQANVWGKSVALETPNLDWLAQNGAIATRCYAASPVCTPSRASFLTGCYPQNTGAIMNNDTLRDDIKSFGDAFIEQGYVTGYLGKLHVNGSARPGWEPERHFGFTDNKYMFNRGHWKQFEDTPEGPRIKTKDPNNSPTYSVDGADEKSFSTDFLCDRTMDFIKKNIDNPFCCMLSLPDPHDPNTVRAPYDTMFNNLTFKAPESAQASLEGLPSWAQPEAPQELNKLMSHYFGMIKCIDDNIGKILAMLRQENLLERTAIVFTSDHGDMCGEHGRHNKSIPLEASSRIPFLLYMPGVIKPNTVVHTVLNTVDFKSTILNLMRLKNNNDEGRDLSWAFIRENTPDQWENETYLRFGSEKVGTKGKWVAVVTEQHKFILTMDEIPCLFDLSIDPFEVKNLAFDSKYREVVRACARKLKSYMARTKDPIINEKSIQATLEWAIEGTGSFNL